MNLLMGTQNRPSPSSAYGVSCRASAKGACAPTHLVPHARSGTCNGPGLALGGGFAPIVGSPAPRLGFGGDSAFTGYCWRGTLHDSLDVCKHLPNICPHAWSRLAHEHGAGVGRNYARAV